MHFLTIKFLKCYEIKKNMYYIDHRKKYCFIYQVDFKTKLNPDVSSFNCEDAWMDDVFNLHSSSDY